MKDLVGMEELVLQTEKSLFGGFKTTTPQVPMWLNLESFNKAYTSKLNLVEISKPEDWELYEKLRTEIEIPFGVTDSKEVKKFIQEIRDIISRTTSSWHFTYYQKQAVGCVGLVEFKFKNQQIGRLLDVDVVPSFQKLGYGNQLLRAVVDLARSKQLTALCLKADADLWVKDWYLKLGFEEVGYWV
jgi:N-acetylglutamate synthase-like GNAT family acetyltransferase